MLKTSDIPSTEQDTKLYDSLRAAEVQELAMIQAESWQVEDGTPTGMSEQQTLSQFVPYRFRFDQGRDNVITFKTRPWLPAIYDSEYTLHRQEDGGNRGYRRRTLLMASRQVEKTIHEDTLVLLESGDAVRISEVHVGQRVVGLVEAGDSELRPGEISWKSKRYVKPCVRIRTRQGHEVVAGLEHPFRRYGEWVHAERISVGDRVAVVRRAGDFGTLPVPLERVSFAAYMLGDGYCSEQHGISFTQAEGQALDEFKSIAARRGWRYRDELRGNGTHAVRLSLAVDSEPLGWLREDGILNQTSFTKDVPSWVWGLPKQGAALFLNRLWATDGHVSLRGSRYSIEYCSVSESLIRSVQRLLWKFGVPSRIRENTPTLYKGTDKVAYILRVETSDGARRFLEDIGALGKSEGIPVPEGGRRSNRDVTPEGLRNDVEALCKTASFQGGNKATAEFYSPYEVGLARTPAYRLTWEKYGRYVDYFKDNEGLYDPAQVEKLSAHINSDVFWDEVVEVTPVGDHPCYDITVEDVHSFVGNGFVTHNSTSLGNKIIGYASLIPNMTCLYVTSADLNLAEFSDERIDNVIRLSPYLKPYIGNLKAFNTYLKRFGKNNSKVVLRSANLTADRSRGIAADLVSFDEIQDLAMGNIDVIRATTNNSPLEYGPMTLMSGTPKTFDNPIERIWSKNSTQNKWLMRCGHCRHENPPHPEQIGPRGLICAKCGYPLNPFEGRWVRHGSADAAYEGYHLSRALMAYTWIGNPDMFTTKWNDLLRDINDPNSTEGSVKNEIFGLSHDDGAKPITERQVRALSHDGLTMSRIMPDTVRNDPHYPKFMGIDWAEGNSGAYTVVTLGFMNDDKFQVTYMHRYMGREAASDYVKRDLLELFHDNNIHVAFCDAGGAWGMIDYLWDNIDDGRKRVLPVQYAPSQSMPIAFDTKSMKITIHRTRWMAKLFNLMKRRKFIFPRWEEFGGTPSPNGGFSQDILTIFSEFTPRTGKKTYNHTEADDAFHSLLYANLAKMWVYEELHEMSHT
jgi:intein/homing endonuclease